MMFDTLSDILPVFFILMFVFVFGVIITTAVKGAQERKKNDAAPVLEEAAQVVTKRSQVERTLRQSKVNDMPVNSPCSRTIYFVTFQVKSGERMEFLVPDQVYGTLAEGDMGQLTFQRSRYLGFRREKLEEK